jgi:hypothetical protein
MSYTTTDEVPRTYRRERGQTHEYYLDGVKVPGVTTIVNGGLPKPALVGWAGNTVAEYAVDNWAPLSKLPPSQRLKKLKGAQYESRDEAGKQGTAIHRIAEKLVKGEPVETIPVGLDDYITSARLFLTDWDVQLVASEIPVFSRNYRYAGTADLIGRSGKLTYLFDFKSNKSGVYGDAAFQTVAYRKADFSLDEYGNEVPLPKIDRCAVVHIRRDGYSVHEVPEADVDVIFVQFLHIKEVAEAVSDAKGYLVEIERA